MKRALTICSILIAMLTACNGNSNIVNNDTVVEKGLDSMPVVKPPLSDSNSTIITPPVKDNNVIMPDTSGKK